MTEPRKPRDGTRLGRQLADLENTDSGVRDAAERLDQVIEDIGSGRKAWHDQMLRVIYGVTE